MNIGQRIKEARTGKSLTQEDLALEIGVSQGAVGQYERNDNLPSLESIANIARALSVTTDWLLGLDSTALQIIQVNVTKLTAFSFIREISTVLESGKLSETQLGLLAALVKELARK